MVRGAMQPIRGSAGRSTSPDGAGRADRAARRGQGIPLAGTPCYDAGDACRVPTRSREIVESVVLLLNADYEPLNVCDVRRAFRLVFGEKAEVIEYDHADIATTQPGLPGAERHPPPAPHPTAAAARAPVAARDLRPRRPHLPVLRQGHRAT